MAPGRDILRRVGSVRRVAVLTTALLAVVGVALVTYQLTASAAPRTTGYQWTLPSGFPKPRVPKNNPMSDVKAEVGRRLFYDKRLSGNQTQSCSSCHLPDRAFTDGRAQAIGSTGQQHPRGAPSLINSAYNQTLAWANPALTTYENQIHVPLFGDQPVEMGINDANKAKVLRRLQRDPWYKRNFRRAFPQSSKPITWTTVIRSISTFERTLVSAGSRYDLYLQGKRKLTPQERRGLNLFMGEKAECHHCHGTFIFSNQLSYAGGPVGPAQFHNNGLYNVGGTGAYPPGGAGLGEITGRPADTGRFRAPSLRNIELTAPYMHDGSIATLEDVVAHYAAGGRNITEGPLAGDGRANPFKDPLIARINLSVGDQADLVAFLKTLTDHTIAKNPRFADPSKRKATKK